MTRILGGDGSDWLRNLKDEDMSYDNKPHNPNPGLTSRSGNVPGYDNHRHPSDSRLGLIDWLLILAVFAALLCLVFGITVWADVPFGGAK